MEGKYNTKSPGVKRLMREAAELSTPTADYFAAPLEENLFEWHFTVRGPEGSDFQDGVYHGRIIVPTEYPMKPPDIILLTPNGRFVVGQKICLSISGFHPETWQPSWSIRTALLAIIGFMPTPGQGTIGSLDYTPQERKILAQKSKDWVCSTCQVNPSQVLAKPSQDSMINQEEVDSIVQSLEFKSEEEMMRRKESSASLKSDSNDSAAVVISDSNDSAAVEQTTDVTYAAVEAVTPSLDNVPRTATAGPPASRPEERSVHVEEPGYQIYDFVILGLVLLIALLLVRRFAAQEGEEGILEEEIEDLSEHSLV